MYITMTVREDGVVSNTFETDTTREFASLFLSLTKTMSGMHDFGFSSVKTEPF